MNRNHKIIIVFLLMMFIGGIVTYINLSTDKVNADGTITANWIDKQKIIKIAKQEILNKIKTPSTAIFAKDNEFVVKISSDDKSLYVVSTYLDAQNEYSAVVRQQVILQILLKPDKTYELKNIIFL